MSKALKWIVGIAIALLVVGAAAVVIWLAWGGFGRTVGMMGALDWRFWDGGRDLPRDQSPYWGMPMHPYSRLPRVGLLPWMPFWGFFGGLICLGVIALIVVGLVALATGLSRSQKPGSVNAPGAGASEPAAMPAATPAAEPARVCPSCARAVQDDWSHCPYCGSGLG